MTLHTVGPADAWQDEKVIGRAYQTWLTPIIAGAPIAATIYLEQKWVIALSISVALVMLHEIGGRLHDLCIRLRRTNLLLQQKASSQ